MSVLKNSLSPTYAVRIDHAIWVKQGPTTHPSLQIMTSLDHRDDSNLDRLWLWTLSITSSEWKHVQVHIHIVVPNFIRAVNVVGYHMVTKESPFDPVQFVIFVVFQKARNDLG